MSELYKMIAKAMEGLKPCPFCGARAMRHSTMSAGYYIECENHHRLSTPDWRETDDVWNQRVTPKED